MQVMQYVAWAAASTDPIRSEEHDVVKFSLPFLVCSTAFPCVCFSAFPCVFHCLSLPKDVAPFSISGSKRLAAMGSGEAVGTVRKGAACLPAVVPLPSFSKPYLAR